MKVYINVKVRAHLFYSSQIAHFFVLLHNYYSWTWPSVWYVRTNKKLCKFPKNKINRVTLFMMLTIRFWKYNSIICWNDFIIVLYQKLVLMISRTCLYIFISKQMSYLCMVIWHHHTNCYRGHKKFSVESKLWKSL